MMARKSLLLGITCSLAFAGNDAIAAPEMAREMAPIAKANLKCDLTQ
jgi:hypothetical protein